MLFYAAFTVKWPLPKTVELTWEELTERLTTLILPEVMLGAMVGTDEEHMYSHVAWAEDVRGVVNALDGPQGYLIPVVYSNLPLAVQMMLLSVTETPPWPAFLDSVVALSLECLCDQLEWMDCTARPTGPTDTALVTHFAMQTLGTAGRYFPAAPSHTPYVPRYAQPMPAATPAAPARNVTPVAQTPLAREGPPHLPAAWSGCTPVPPTTPFMPSPVQGRYTPSTPANPFYTANDRTSQGNSIFVKGPPATPQTPTRAPGPLHFDLATWAVSSSTMYTDTVEGAAAYNTAMTSWLATYGANRSTDFMTLPLPLCPGSMNIGSHECFKCAGVGHIGSGCPNLATQLDRCEQDWHWLVSCCLFANPCNDGGTYRVLQISADDVAITYNPTIYDTEVLDFEETEGRQGNGEEVRK